MQMDKEDCHICEGQMCFCAAASDASELMWMQCDKLQHCSFEVRCVCLEPHTAGWPTTAQGTRKE